MKYLYSLYLLCGSILREYYFVKFFKFVVFLRDLSVRSSMVEFQYDSTIKLKSWTMDLCLATKAKQLKLSTCQDFEPLAFEAYGRFSE